MLRSVKSLQKFSISAVDGQIGEVDTFYFDDEGWTIRYLVVDTTSWGLGPKVLISPMSIRRTDWDAGTMLLSSTREQIWHSPHINTAKPVSRQHEHDYHRYYHYPNYWGNVGRWGAETTPAELAGSEGDQNAPVEVQHPVDLESAATDVHLRSTHEVIGYHIQAKDRELGHVEDFLVDDRTWALRYAVVDTSNWWVGNKVLIAVEWIEDVSWPEGTVSVDLPRQAVKDAPAYRADTRIDSEWETQYFAHYQRHGRWQTRGAATPGLVSLKQHRELKVASTDADPRGWTVVSGTDGRILGKVHDLIADPRTMKIRYLDVDLDNGLRQEGQAERREHFLLPAAYARVSSRGEQVTAEGLGAQHIPRLPAYDALPNPSEYDDAFQASLKENRVDSALANEHRSPRGER